MKPQKRYLVISIDTECDKSLDWSVRYPWQFRNITEGIPKRLQPVWERVGIRPTYLLSPEVIVDTECRSLFSSLGTSVELGTHLHGEYVEPKANFSAKYTEEFQCDYERELELAKLENLTTMFDEAFGYKPKSFRAGRWGWGTNTLSILQNLGYQVDSSLYPFSRLMTKSGEKNYYYWPTEPYFPLEAGSKGGPSTILEVPFTVYSTFYMGMPRLLSWPFSRSSLLEAGLTRVVGRSPMRTYCLRPSTYDFEILKSVIDHYEAAHRASGIVVLNMMFHSNEIIENCSPYSRSVSDVQVILDRIEQTTAYGKQLGYKSIGLGETYEIFKKARRTT